jgi:anti-sigma factor RsiW
MEPSRQAAVAEHIEVCADCRAETDLLRATRESFSPAALGMAEEPDWAAMRQKVLRAARTQEAAPGLIERVREWLELTWSPARLRPAFVAVAVVVICAMGFYLAVGPYLFGPQAASNLASLKADELEALSDALPTEGESDLLGTEPLDAQTLRELSKLSPEELERLLKTM